MPGPGTYIISDTQGKQSPMGLIIAKVPWYKLWDGYIGGDLVYRIGKPCRKYDRHGNPYIHWDWSGGIGKVTPIAGGAGQILAGSEAGTLMTDSTSGTMSYTALGGDYIGPVVAGSSVSPTDPTIPDC